MADATDVTVLTHDGIEVEVDNDYVRSWEGLETAAIMQSERTPANDRFFATVNYFRNACPNIDAVSDALRERADGAVTGDAVMTFVADAIREGTPKN